MEAKIVMHYFGTELDYPGHYFWVLDDNHMSKSGIWFTDIPFNPEGLTQDEKGNSLNKGEVRFYNFEDYTVLAISGAPGDKRNGCKSVFWVSEKLDYEEMKKKIFDIPIAKKLIDAMPFEVFWKN